MFNDKRFISSIKFLLLFLGLYVSWELLYDLFLKDRLLVDLFIVNNLGTIAKEILGLLGYVSSYDKRILTIEGYPGVMIGDPCNGLELLALFTFFIVAFPKRKWNYKVGYTLLGIVIIHCSNIIRVVALALINLYAPSSLDFNHSYTFTVFVYSIIFFLWMFWVNLKQSIKIDPNEV